MILIFIYTIFTYGIVYADPNSSKGFAEYDDVKAEEETKQMVQEQEKQQEEAIGKSTNNYLKDLKVEGYTISPSFDKQTVDYILEERINVDEITILAIPDDEKATVEGNGKIKLDANQKEFRIDVVAESRNSKNLYDLFRRARKGRREKSSNRKF